MTVNLVREALDRELLALSLVEALEAHNDPQIRTILNSATPWAVASGALTLSGRLINSICADRGDKTTGQTIAALREFLLSLDGKGRPPEWRNE